MCLENRVFHSILLYASKIDLCKERKRRKLVGAYRCAETSIKGYLICRTATVISLLADDLNGDRYQRFIIELKSGQTLLISHNIDLAPRIDGLSLNDQVEFFGEYEWNDKGGVIHWTHHDPDGIHVDGWLFHNHVIYQ